MDADGSAHLVDLHEQWNVLADAGDTAHLRRFFKMGPGEYGENDRFLGVRVPVLRRLARHYKYLTLAQMLELLGSPWHEERLLALLLNRQLTVGRVGDNQKEGVEGLRHRVESPCRIPAADQSVFEQRGCAQ